MRILLDCDGVLSNYVEHLIFELNAAMGTNHTPGDVYEWEVYDALEVPENIRARMELLVQQPGFCAGLPEIPVAAEAMKCLRASGHSLYCVTAPFIGNNWMHERRDWLRRHMGFHRKQVIFCYDKEVTQGDVLIDDKVDNLLKWSATNPEGTAILFEQPWNRNDPHWDGIRVDNWPDLVALLDGYDDEY